MPEPEETVAKEHYCLHKKASKLFITLKRPVLVFELLANLDFLQQLFKH